MGDDRAGEAASEGPCGAVALRVVAAAAWHVVRGRRFADFPRVLTFLENVAEAAPELVPFQHLAKLRLGLQAKIVMNMLQEDQPQGKIYDAIDTYFPENEAPLHHSKATAKDLEMVQTAQENFRILILRLLSDSMQKDIYVQLLEAASVQTPSQLPQPSATILNQYFSAVGYQRAGYDEPPPSPPPPSSAPRQSGDEDPQTPPRSPQPDRSRSVDSPSCISEGDSHRQSSETTEDLVPDSESEGSTSPFQGEYRGTHLCTLIPTFREHLRESSSQLNSSLL
ncbi:TERF1-interacting nuclear factor 2 isoform X4 [Ahaetulla prasina]|uniref:TERF1-interacting nuclear factor 2 isoform X4 n=1 Tax=Ahaetulla prasina TaxID=499056 RepID=UPI002648A833|nr:TERF1-interacting nuclear factor 2 isoform X4 [Ahaetulla prasina]